jgi:GNAT acetyltransferase-like protein
MKGEMWAPNADALTLLDLKGGPFSTTAFREAVVVSIPGWRDVSIGACTTDGTMAAIPLLTSARGTESVPPSGYGGVVASRSLDRDETVAFLKLASRKHRLSRMRVRSLELADSPVAGTRFVTACVIPINGVDPPAARYARLARRSLKRAEAAGATVSVESFDAFWPVYEEAAHGWGITYPEFLVRRLVDNAVARVHSVRLGGKIVASLLTLVSGSHWMCWLAGQNKEGRSIAASYLAYDAVLKEAQASGVAAVNLGASVGGGSEFKHHLGATEVWMREWNHETVAAAVTRIARNVAAPLARAARTNRQ